MLVRQGREFSSHPPYYPKAAVGRPSPRLCWPSHRLSLQAKHFTIQRHPRWPQKINLDYAMQVHSLIHSTEPAGGQGSEDRDVIPGSNAMPARSEAKEATRIYPRLRRGTSPERAGRSFGTARMKSETVSRGVPKRDRTREYKSHALYLSQHAYDCTSVRDVLVRQGREFSSSLGVPGPSRPQRHPSVASQALRPPPFPALSAPKNSSTNSRVLR